MAERKSAKALACSSLQERTNVNLDVPLQGRSTVCSLHNGSLHPSQEPKGLRWSPGAYNFKNHAQLNKLVLSCVLSSLPWHKVYFVSMGLGMKSQ